MYSSAYRAVSTALAQALTRAGVHVGLTAGYPRVETHTFNENAPLDKGGALRVISCVVESMAVTSPEDAESMNAANLTAIQGLALAADSGFRVVGVVPTQLQELTETSDTQQILYRALQSVDIYVQQQ